MLIFRGGTYVSPIALIFQLKERRHALSTFLSPAPAQIVSALPICQFGLIEWNYSFHLFAGLISLNKRLDKFCCISFPH